jgi:hypothetical protein
VYTFYKMFVSKHLLQTFYKECAHVGLLFYDLTIHLSEIVITEQQLLLGVTFTYVLF